MSDIDKTLAERGTRYGAFSEHARITQNLKRAMIDSPNWSKLSDDKREALEMLQHKVGRILNGDPEFHDSWHTWLVTPNWSLTRYRKAVRDGPI